MYEIFKSVEDELLILEEIEDGCWINMVDPTDQELHLVSNKLDVEIDFLRAALDEEERSRTEYDEGNVLILVDLPLIESKKSGRIYDTIPLGIIYTKDHIVTVCLKETIIVKIFASNRVKTFYTFKKTRFIFQMLYRNAVLFLQYLKLIDKQSSALEEELHRTMRNRELISMMDLQKSLVYFSTSLKANELVLEKLLRNELIKKYPEDTDLLEDAIIENKQAIEMAKIYGDILSSYRDAFASIISNNLNTVMKTLTSITIIMSIPNVISGFYGMNVLELPLDESPLGFWLIVLITLVVCVATYFFMSKKKLF